MDPEKIKSIVRKNFEESTEIYVKFEERYGFFWALTRELFDFCKIRKGMNVLDVGCGTGASSFYLSYVARRVVGIDLSEGMIALAQKNKKSNTIFIVGDGEKLSSYVNEKFNAVCYNASIFLLPSPKKSLESARIVLEENGVCGASYPLGLFSEGEDIMGEARRAGLASDGTFVKSEDIENAFSSVFGSYEERRLDISMSLGEAEAFYSIPAQSASLFPKIPYEERIPLLKILFSCIEKKYEKVEMVWGLIKGER